MTQLQWSAKPSYLQDLDGLQRRTFRLTLLLVAAATQLALLAGDLYIRPANHIYCDWYSPDGVLWPMLLDISALSACRTICFCHRSQRGKYHSIRILCVAGISLLSSLRVPLCKYATAEARNHHFCSYILRHCDWHRKK